MKTIKHIDVKVTYSVGIGNIEVPDDVYEDLMNCECRELTDDDLSLTDNDVNALEWLKDNIREEDCYNIEFEIEEIE